MRLARYGRADGSGSDELPASRRHAASTSRSRGGRLSYVMVTVGAAGCTGLLVLILLFLSESWCCFVPGSMSCRSDHLLYPAYPVPSTIAPTNLSRREQADSCLVLLFSFCLWSPPFSFSSSRLHHQRGCPPISLMFFASYKYIYMYAASDTHTHTYKHTLLFISKRRRRPFRSIASEFCPFSPQVIICCTST